MLIATLHVCYSVGALAAPRLDLYATREWLRMVRVQLDGCEDEVPHCPDGKRAFFLPLLAVNQR